MFSTHEYVMAAEADYRREQLLATLPARRARAGRRARFTRIAARALGRSPAPTPAVQGSCVACAA